MQISCSTTSTGCCWIEIWWLRGPPEYSELFVRRHAFSFVTWCIVPWEVVIRWWAHCGHKGMDMMSSGTQVGPKCATKIPYARVLQLRSSGLTALHGLDVYLLQHTSKWAGHYQTSAVLITSSSFESGVLHYAITPPAWTVDARQEGRMLSSFSEPTWIVASVFWS